MKEPLIIADWGDPKSGKTTFGLTFEQPIWYADFDLRLGGALHRFPGIKLTRVKYPVPIHIGRQLKGVRELYEKFIREFMGVLDNSIKFETGEEFRSIVIDTGSQMRKVISDALLQTKQETQIVKNNGCVPVDLRERLSEIEYAEPNRLCQAIIYAPRQHDKHLLLAHYEEDEYEKRLVDGKVESMKTGKKILGGFNKTEGLVDLVVHTYSHTPKATREAPNPAKEFYGKVTVSGLHADLEGMEFRDPSFEQIVKTLSMLRGEE